MVKKETGWQDPAAIEELEAKIKLARMGVPVRVKEPVVALLTGVSKKKLQSDRQANVGLPFIVVACPTPKEGAKPRGSVFYDLGVVLAHLQAGDGGNGVTASKVALALGTTVPAPATEWVTRRLVGLPVGQQTAALIETWAPLGEGAR